MSHKLSPAQIRALGELANGPMSDVELLIHVGFNWRQTCSKLASMGLVEGGRHSGYHLTVEGKATVKELLDTGDLIRETL